MQLASSAKRLDTSDQAIIERKCRRQVCQLHRELVPARIGRRGAVYAGHYCPGHVDLFTARRGPPRVIGLIETLRLTRLYDSAAFWTRWTTPAMLSTKSWGNWCLAAR